MFKERRLVWRGVGVLAQDFDKGGVPYGGNLGLSVGERIDSRSLRTLRVRELFREHVKECLVRGGRFVATDTFHARRLLLEISGYMNFADLVRDHLALVVEVCEELGLPVKFIYQALGPVGDCYLDDSGPEEARDCVADQVGLTFDGWRQKNFANSGRVRFLFETIPSEVKLIGTVEGVLTRLKNWPKGHHVPVFTLSLCLDESGNFRGGKNPIDILHEILNRKEVIDLVANGRIRFGLNCLSIRSIENFFSNLRLFDLTNGTNYYSLFRYLAPNAAPGNAWDAEALAEAGEPVPNDPSIPSRAAEIIRHFTAGELAYCCGHDHSVLSH